MTIWKYALSITDITSIDIPSGARILSVQMQNGVPCIWALVDESRPKVSRPIAICGTGNPIDNAVCATGTFIGTFQVAGGELVFHVFDLGEFRR